MKSTMSKLSLMVAMLTVVAMGCGPGSAGGCKVTNAAYCIDYTGTSFTADAVKKSCPSTIGTYQAAGCGTGAAKACVFNKGTATETRWVFPSADAGAGVSPEAVCKAGGGIYQ